MTRSTLLVVVLVLASPLLHAQEKVEIEKIARYLARGLDAVLILDYGHPDYDVRTAAGVAAFARYAAAAVQRYAGPRVRFEVWNEPNHPTYWGGAPDAAEYAALADGALSAIRAVAPGAVVSTGGLSYFDFPYLAQMLRLGAADAADAVALHAYETPEGLAEKWVQADRLIRDVLGEARPLWITEWGYTLGNAGAASRGDDPAFLDRQAHFVLVNMVFQARLSQRFDQAVAAFVHIVDPYAGRDLSDAAEQVEPMIR